MILCQCTSRRKGDAGEGGAAHESKFWRKKLRERKRCDFFSSFHIFFTFSDASDLACCSAPVPRAYLLSLDVLFSHGAQLDVFVILKSAQV